MTGKRAISTVNRSSELICHWVDLWCAIDFVNLILFRLLSNGFGVLISRFESQWNMNGSSSSFMFMLKLENTYVSPATGFSSLRAEIGQEKRFFVILKAENFITRDLNGNHLWTHFMRLYTINEICVMDFDHDRFWTKKWLMFSLSVNEIAASLLEMGKNTHTTICSLRSENHGRCFFDECSMRLLCMLWPRSVITFNTSQKLKMSSNIK